MSTSTYRPIVDLDTGREYQDDGSAPSTAVRLEPTDVDGAYRAPSGEIWLGCTDGVWRHRASLTATLQPDASKERLLQIIAHADDALEQHPLDVSRQRLAEIKRLARAELEARA